MEVNKGSKKRPRQPENEESSQYTFTFKSKEEYTEFLDWWNLRKKLRVTSKSNDEEKTPQDVGSIPLSPPVPPLSLEKEMNLAFQISELENQENSINNKQENFSPSNSSYSMTPALKQFNGLNEDQIQCIEFSDESLSKLAYPFYSIEKVSGTTLLEEKVWDITSNKLEATNERKSFIVIQAENPWDFPHFWIPSKFSQFPKDVKSVIKTILMLALIDSNKEPVHTDSYFTLLDKRILFEIFSWVWLLDERSIQDFESPTFKWVVNSVTPNYYFIPHDYAIYCLLQATKNIYGSFPKVYCFFDKLQRVMEAHVNHDKMPCLRISWEKPYVMQLKLILQTSVDSQRSFRIYFAAVLTEVAGNSYEIILPVALFHRFNTELNPEWIENNLKKKMQTIDKYSEIWRSWKNQNASIQFFGNLLSEVITNHSRAAADELKDYIFKHIPGFPTPKIELYKWCIKHTTNSYYWRHFEADPLNLLNVTEKHLTFCKVFFRQEFMNVTEEEALSSQKHKKITSVSKRQPREEEELERMDYKPLRPQKPKSPRKYKVTTGSEDEDEEYKLSEDAEDEENDEDRQSRQEPQDISDVDEPEKFYQKKSPIKSSKKQLFQREETYAPLKPLDEGMEESHYHSANIIVRESDEEESPHRGSSKFKSNLPIPQREIEESEDSQLDHSDYETYDNSRNRELDEEDLDVIEEGQQLNAYFNSQRKKAKIFYSEQDQSEEGSPKKVIIMPKKPTSVIGKRSRGRPRTRSIPIRPPRPRGRPRKNHDAENA